MFNIFKEDVKVGDHVKIFLTTGKEPEGQVMIIGVNFVIIELDGIQTRFFDKLIGGWELIRSKRQTGPKKGKGKNWLKDIEKEINQLIRDQKYHAALVKIEKETNGEVLDNKYKSSLLLKRAQIYSALNNPQSSEVAYKELITFNENVGSSANNLSHLYTELARLQSTEKDKIEEALISLKRALSYNGDNQFARNLFRQVEQKLDNKELFNINIENIPTNFVVIETTEKYNTISRLIDIDIREHKYTHPEILKNNGASTAYLAKLILEQAKVSRVNDLSARYPLYLEAAKAFSELNIGSYDLQDYLEAVAYYSMLKGNALYFNFRNKVNIGETQFIPLTRLKDSACSYYIEALNILSNISPSSLLVILANYMQMHIVTYHIEKNIKINYESMFKMAFDDVLLFCLRNKNSEIEKIGYKTILNIGASSLLAWNTLGNLKNGTGRFYGEFLVQENRIIAYDLLNRIGETTIDVNISPKDFLKESFQLKRSKDINFLNNFDLLTREQFEPAIFSMLKGKWSGLEIYAPLLSGTDIETKKEIETVLSIVQPYLNRNKNERTNILLQARSIIERQLKFINENTTYFGRILFYNLLVKWKKDIDALLEEKIAQSYPFLELIVDPPYYIDTDSEISAPLVIKNIGETTSEGFILTFNLKYPSGENEEIIYENDVEIPAGSRVETAILIPPVMLDSTAAVELSIVARARYQNRLTQEQKFQFTIEKEPLSRLTYDDIPWHDGPIPPEDMFKGRRKLIADLAQHYLSPEKDKSYILYGLTRTGKSSVLQYLRKNIEGDTFLNRSQEMRVITFAWDFSEAASQQNAQDFYYYILYQQTYEVIEQHFANQAMDIKIMDRPKFKDFKIILDFLKSKNLYPVFFVDEFSFVKMLIDNHTINSAFLHSLRQFSLDEHASFIFSGTYDIKALIKDPKYAITGQLVNTIEYQVNEISDESSTELINVIKDKLSFTQEAISHIQLLSGNIPYFIQIICKYCGYYSSENKRRVIGYPELEKVIRILVGQDDSNPKSFVKRLSETTFQNNQFSPADPKEVFVLISSIVHFNKNELRPRGVGFHELQKLWADQKLSFYRPKLADTIEILKEKKILIQKADEFLPTYQLAVDLFRRWWFYQNPDINLILSTLTTENNDNTIFDQKPN